MSLRRRTMFLLSLLLTGAVLVTASVLTSNARQSLLDEQRGSGEVLARMLARAAYIVQNLPDEMENGIGEQMVVEATITSHFVAAAEAAGWPPEKINQHLKDIVAHTSVSEFWITDEKGHAYLRNQDALDFTFSPSPIKNPQAYVFYPLLTGEKTFFIQRAEQRDVDKKVFKYVGVGGVDKPRIVQVGFEANALNAVRQRVSLDRLGLELVNSGDLRALRIFNAAADSQVFQAAADVPEKLSATDAVALRRVIATGARESYIDGQILKVIEPIRSIDTSGDLNNNEVHGAVMLYLPTTHLQEAVERQLVNALVSAFVILIFGLIMSIVMTNAFTRPLDYFRDAAASIQAGNYQPAMIASVVRRKDELGRLALVFDQMAREVSARDRRLNLLRVIIPLGVALSAEKDFSRLLETIVVEAQHIAHADAGSLYLLEGATLLRFVIVRNNTLKIALGGTTGNPVTLSPIALYDAQGKPNHHHIASYCALTGKVISVKDAYQTTEFDLSGTRAFDEQTGYHTKSMLTLPLKDTANHVIGVLQLLNARDHVTGETTHFHEDEVVESLALITSAALSAYIREETLREEINKLRIEIDHSRQDKQVEEIAESDYFKQLQAQAAAMRKKRNG